LWICLRLIGDMKQRGSRVLMLGTRLAFRLQALGM
jgi:hypothetical protein